MNCAALPDGQIESALFGEKGALMGSSKRSALERANNGSTLLRTDRRVAIGSSGKLLRVLHEREFERIGGPVSQNGRSNRRDHDARSRERGERRSIPSGSLLSAERLPISIPPFAIAADIPCSRSAFAPRRSRSRKGDSGIRARCPRAAVWPDWPGGVRQLQNVVERAVILSTDETLPVHLFASLRATRARRRCLGACAKCVAEWSASDRSACARLLFRST
jgi:transcriptional regulator with GAF, ATPase, and Fis domain